MSASTFVWLLILKIPNFDFHVLFANPRQSLTKVKSTANPLHQDLVHLMKESEDLTIHYLYELKNTSNFTCKVISIEM